MKNIFLIGGGGFAIEIISYLFDIKKKTNQEFNILGIVDKDKSNEFFFISTSSIFGLIFT